MLLNKNNNLKFKELIKNNKNSSLETTFQLFKSINKDIEKDFHKIPISSFLTEQKIPFNLLIKTIKKEKFIKNDVIKIINNVDNKFNEKQVTKILLEFYEHNKNKNNSRENLYDIINNINTQFEKKNLINIEKHYPKVDCLKKQKNFLSLMDNNKNLETEEKYYASSNQYVTPKILDFNISMDNFNNLIHKEKFLNNTEITKDLINSYVNEDKYELRYLFENEKFTEEHLKIFNGEQIFKNMKYAKHLKFSKDFIFKNIEIVSPETIVNSLKSKEDIEKRFDLINDENLKNELFKNINELFNYDYYQKIALKYNIKYEISDKKNYLNNNSDKKDYLTYFKELNETFKDKEEDYLVLLNYFVELKSLIKEKNIPFSIIKKYYIDYFNNLDNQTKNDKDYDIDEIYMNIFDRFKIDFKEIDLKIFSDIDKYKGVLVMRLNQDLSYEEINIIEEFLKKHDKDSLSKFYAYISTNKNLMKKNGITIFNKYIKKVNDNDKDLINSETLSLISFHINDEKNEVIKEIKKDNIVIKDLNNNIGIY